MIIQPLLFPKQEVCPEQKMYYRIKEDKISLETYFNAFSIGKWKKYTDLDNLYFEVESEEALQFTCVHAVGSVAAGHDCTREMIQKESPSKYVAVVRRKIPCSVSKDGNKYHLQFEELPDDGILYVNIKCQKEVSDISEVLLSGGYGTCLLYTSDAADD